MRIDISQEDLGTLCICALRYCHGRKTYMPSLVQGIAKTHLSKISTKDLHVMLNDCNDQEKFGTFGDEHIDKPGWLRWKETVEDELRKRGENI